MKKVVNFLNLYFLMFIFSINNVKAEDCKSVLGGGALVDEIKEIFHIIGYVTLVIAIVMGMLDFFKTIVGGDKADLKTVGTKFVKRLLAVSLFFILPALVEWLLDISGISHGGTCLD